MTMRPSKLAVAAAKVRAEMEIACERARDIGREHYASAPEAMLIAVARHGATLFPERKDCQIAFLQGYSAARARHDAFKRGE